MVRSLARLLPLALSLSALGCTHLDRSGSGGKSEANPVPSVVSVTAQVTSVLLADDCQTAEAPAPAPAKMAAPAAGAPASPAATAAPADMAPGMAPSRRACQQSTMQLELTGSTKGTPATIEIARVRLLDDATGKELAQLVPRNPQAWSQKDSRYAPWDRTLSPARTLAVSFDLSAPDWDQIGNGSRWNTQDMTFRVEVTVRTGSGTDQKVEKTVKSPFLMREPPVPT